MHDPKPLASLMFLGLVGCLGMVWWLATQADPQRQRLLIAIMLAEGGHGVIPEGLFRQCDWLIQHRLTTLAGMSGVVALCGAIGMAEGFWRRAQAVRGGFMMTWWTVGLVGIVGVCVLGCWYVLAPVVIPPRVAGVTLGVLGGGGLYGLSVGVPKTP